MERRHRADRRVREKKGKRVNVEVTPRARTQIFPLLVRYPLLPMNWIHHFVGGDYQSLQKYCSSLALAPHFYLMAPAAQFEPRYSDYNFMLMALGPGGAKEIGVPRPQAIRNVKHKHLESIFEASIAIGVAENPRYSRIEWPQIFEELPQETKALKDPCKIPVFKRELFIRPDGQPFVIYDHEHDEGLFCVFEADCNSESRFSKEFTNTIQFKVEAYLDILQNDIHGEHFDAQTFQVFFICDSEDGAQTILEVIEEVMKTKEAGKLKYDPALAAHFCVSRTYLYRTKFNPPPELPGGFMFTRYWKRACGHPDFCFLEE